MKMTAKLITVILTAVMIFSLTSCVANVNLYDHGDSYTAGDFETSSEVTALDIDWSSGLVNVSHHDKDTVSVTETCNVELKDSQKVHTWLDGKTLHIRFCKSGESFNLTNAEKKLEVKLPKTIELEKLSYDGSSAEARFEDISATDFSVDTSSGDVTLSDCSANTFNIDSSSGDIILSQKGETEKLSADSSSGTLTFDAEKIGELKADTSSGKMKFNIGCADKVSTDSSSGDVELRLGAMPAETVMDGSAGDVRLYLPKDASFTAEVDTASGDFDSELSLSKKGDTYVCGDGTNTLDIDTSSGDVKIFFAE